MQQSRENLLVRIAGQIVLGGLAFRCAVFYFEAVHLEAILELAVGLVASILLDDVGRTNSKIVRRR